MRRSMKRAAKKRSMKKGKSMKKRSMKKRSMKKRSMKKKRVSKIARGKLAKFLVFSGSKAKTTGGLTAASLVKNKNGRVVSKAKSAGAKKRFAKSKASKWMTAVARARKAMGVKGFQAVGGKTAKGQALLKKARSF